MKVKKGTAEREAGKDEKDIVKEREESKQFKEAEERATKGKESEGGKISKCTESEIKGNLLLVKVKKRKQVKE